MALSTEISRSFRLYVTHVDGEGHFLRISGQLDQQASLMIESLFETARENLEKGIGAVSPGSIHEGIICAAKYKDGTYYRAKVINMTNIATGLVGVHFIDFGNKDIISLSTIRFLDNYDPMFLQLRGQATDYYLSRVINPSGRWEEPMLMKLQSLLCYSEYPVTLDVHTQSLPLISIQFKGNDLSTHLVSIRFGMAIPTAKQEVILLQMSESQHPPTWQTNYSNDAPAFSEHVPFLLNQSYPANPASAMRVQQNIPLPFNGSIAASTSLMSKRLIINNKVPRTSANLKAPIRQPQQAMAAPSFMLSTPPPATATPPFPATAPKPPKKFATYKSKLLELNSHHKVFVSYAEEGPDLFAVQLVSEAKNLQDMMDEINRRPHSSLTEPPMIGTVCLGRMSGDRIICRAIVMNLSGSQCKLFFVDFGDTELISYYDIFDIPEEFVKPNVYAMRFCLSGVKTLEKGPHLNEAFKQLASGKVLTLKVVAPEGPPLIQYGELYLEDKNILELLEANMKDKVQFKWPEMLPMGGNHSVLVSYVDSCIKFYIQLSEQIEALNGVMEAVRAHCESSAAPGELGAGAACCARFPDDGKWYRALVRGAAHGRALVAYVDYGNEQEVDARDLRSLPPGLAALPAQAVKCALKGFENRPVETKTSNQLEMLALEKTLMCHVVGVLSSDTTLVTLVDDTVVPPLDIARKMNQLSQPRSSLEVKAPAPARKEPGESPGAADGAEEARRRAARRLEPDERRDPARRGGGGGGGGGGRARDSPPAADDDWDEAPGQARPARDAARDRRKPREGGWKKDGGVGRRLRQAAEAAAGAPPRERERERERERARRDTKFNQQEEREERRNDDWGSRSGGARATRGDRRDNWGERGPRRDAGTRDRGDFGNRERNDFGNRERNDFGNRERNDFGNKERNDFGNRERNDFGNRERNDGNRERNDFGNRDRNESGRDRNEPGHRERSSPRARGGRGGLSPRARAERPADPARPPPCKPRPRPAPAPCREVADPAPLDSVYAAPAVKPGEQVEVSVTWIVSPESFYVQILSLQAKFLEMMHEIPELYKGVRPYEGPVGAGAAVLARYPADGVLYRAAVVAAQPLSRFVVQYVDFGNKQVVEARDLWQLDRRLLALPRMAVHCALQGARPAAGDWRAGPELDRCFSAPRYQCLVREARADRLLVQLWSDGASVADELAERGLAEPPDPPAEPVVLKDEPIDMSLLAGQRLLCRVTHVAARDQLWLQLDLDKAARLEEAVDGFDPEKLVAPAAELVAPGTHCTVRAGGRVRRAVLHEHEHEHEQDGAGAAGTLRALLPDYGEELTVTRDQVMILPAELSVYYYQALRCSLRAALPGALPELRAALTGRTHIVHVHDLDGITLVGSLHALGSGEALGAGGEARVAPLVPRAVLGRGFGRAHVSHAASLARLYLQRAADADRLALLLDRLYEFYENGSPEPLASTEPATLCAAKSADGNWYRASVVAAEDGRLRVHFPDYGNSETVGEESLRRLDPRFHEPCSLALEAGLGLRPLRDEALARLLEWTADRELQVTVSAGAGGWLAGLHLDGVDLAGRLVEEGLAAPAGAPGPAPAEPPAGCVQMYISHIDTPGHFWLQAVESERRLEELQAALQAAAGAYADVASRDLGTLCVAKYLADEQWYRAEILDSDADITTVRFIDYGNTDVLDTRPGLIKELPAELREVERFAVRSSVNAVPTGTGEWSEAAGELFARLAGDLAAPVAARVVLRADTTYVDLLVDGQNLTDRLVEEGHAARAGGGLPSCFASHVNSPAEFWIQLESATAELQAMEAAMEHAERFPALEAREEGALCAARYPEDGAWYRAQLVVEGSAGTEVLFMDYGNASIALELRALPAELRRLPALSRKCALQKPRHIKAWSRGSEVRFNELAAEGATIFNVQFVASGDISIVELYLEGESVTEQLVALCEERPAPLGRDRPAAGRVCYARSADEFYVQGEEAAGEEARVAEALAAAAGWAPPEPRAGALCAAHWPEDGHWYRARLLECCDAGWHVQFVDYGNRAKCEQLRALPAALAAAEPLARRCRLAAAPPPGPLLERAREKLDELALDAVPVRIEYLDSTTEPALVKVWVDGLDLLSMLTADALAEVSLDPDVETTKESAEETDSSIPEKEFVEKTQDTEADADRLNKSVEERTEKAVENAVEPPTVVKSAIEAPKGIESAIEAPKVVESTVQAPDIIESAVETYKVIESDVEGPKVNESAAEAPKVIESAVEAPKVVESAVEAPKVVESAVEAPKVVESTIEAPKVDESVVEGPKVAESAGDEPKNINIEHSASMNTVEVDRDDEFDDAEDGLENDKLNTSHPDLDESVDSTDTVVENTSFEAEASAAVDEDEGVATETPSTPDKDASAATLDGSDVPETSRGSLHADTGYMSSGDRDRSDKDTDSPKRLPSPGTSPGSTEIEQSHIEPVQVESKAIVSEILSEIVSGKETAKEMVTGEVATDASAIEAKTD